MGLATYKLGTFIEQRIVRNSDGLYSDEHTIGVNIDKEIRPMKGNTDNKNLETFYLVEPGRFVYNPRGSRKLGLGYNDTSNTYITTFNNIIFQLNPDAQTKMLPEFLFLYLSRKEWDRRAEYLSWGSSTEVFSWHTLCDVDITLPTLEIQQKYVDVYNAILANQQAYERGLDELKLTCGAYLEKLMEEMIHEPIGSYLSLSEERNTNLDYDETSVRGLSTSKEIIPTKANLVGVKLDGYKLLKPFHVAFVADTSRRGEKISLAINTTDETYLVSSISTVFTSNSAKLLPKYLQMFFERPEFDRYARYHSWGSARETFTWDDMQAVKIPIPPIEVQQAIVDIYTVYLTRREINDTLKQQLKKICPILIKGAMDEAAGGDYAH